MDAFSKADAMVQMLSGLFRIGLIIAVIAFVAYRIFRKPKK